MPGKARPSLRSKTIANVWRSNLSDTDKACIEEVFERYEQLQKEATMCRHRPTDVELLLREIAIQLIVHNREFLTGRYDSTRVTAEKELSRLMGGYENEEIT